MGEAAFTPWRRRRAEGARRAGRLRDAQRACNEEGLRVGRAGQQVGLARPRIEEARPGADGRTRHALGRHAIAVERERVALEVRSGKAPQGRSTYTKVWVGSIVQAGRAGAPPARAAAAHSRKIPSTARPGDRAGIPKPRQLQLHWQDDVARLSLQLQPAIEFVAAIAFSEVERKLACQKRAVSNQASRSAPSNSDRRGAP